MRGVELSTDVALWSRLLRDRTALGALHAAGWVVGLLVAGLTVISCALGSSSGSTHAGADR